ncbi:trypsin-like peptidase domain-containing protein [Kitasatospora purpeofusca]|uniref:nSTAND1 domain-containing NTPase n=1 Tax=Kitasatospora purpeofusca TaxID=67352 RepID=UPI0036D245EB
MVGRGTLRAGAGDGLPAAVVQVRDGAGLVVGAGFLVADGLVVTCAHVLEDGGYGPGSVVTLVFPHAPGVPEVTGRVLEEAWRDPHEQDVALVRLERAVGVAPLSLGSAAGARGHRVCSFGFPVQAPTGGHFGFATAGGLLPAADSAGELLQLTGANDLTQGFSGGPVLDEATGLVVGMLTAITAPDAHDRGLGIAYVTPAAVLREVWPALGELDVSPYRALEPFTAEHARWFRGREDAVNRVLAGLAGGRRVVLLLGPSGSGKSSLVQAGVLPALAAGRLPGSDRWRQVLTRPGPDLPGALSQAGLPGSEDGDAAGVPDARTVLVVDQFEELLAPSAGPEALQALARITAAIRSDADLSVVLVMRDDFYSRLSALAPDLLDTAQRASGVLNVPATLSAADLDAIVTGPARDLDTTFEPGLAEQIIANVLELNPRTDGAGGAPVTVLPLLEVALTRLWERRLEYDGRLTHDAYQRIGAVIGALTDWCNAALRELDPRQRDIARKILTGLVRPADPSLNIPAARQQLPISDLRDMAAEDKTPDARRAVDEVLAVLSRHRIVTTDRVHEGARPEDAEGTAVAELVHDALIRDWETLREWVEQDQRFHDWLRRARDQYDRWKEHRDPQDLPTGTLLAEGIDLASHRHGMPASLDAFLTTGRRRQQAAARRSRRLNIVLAAALALALIAAGVAFWQRQQAVAARQVAESRQFAAQSASLIDADPDLAALLAVNAYLASPTKEAAAALRDGAHLPLRHRFSHTGFTHSVVFSPDGRTLAGAGATVSLWDVASGSTTATLIGHTGYVRSVAFSPDGRTLTTGGDDGTVRLWDVASGSTTATLSGHTGPVSSVVFSLDGRTLATAGDDGTVRLWDVASGSTTATLSGHTGPVRSVVFSLDGRTLATAGDDGTVRLWDVASGSTTATLSGHTGPVRSVVFSLDGRTLATAGDDGTVRFWDTASGRMVTTLTGHTGPVRSVAFSPDGRTLATAGDDLTVRLWDTASGTPLTPLPGRTDAVSSVAFSPDGRTLATADTQGIVRLWDEARIRSATTLTGHTGFVRSVVFSPDGRTLTTGGDDGTVRLWDVASGSTTATLSGHTGPVSSVVFSLDGRTLATAGDDGTVRLWDVASGSTTATLSGHTGPVRSVVFSPDGRTLTTAGDDGTVRFWDTASGRMVTTLTDHAGPVRSAAFSPDGRTLATTSEGVDVRLWDTATGKALTTPTALTGHTGYVRAVAFSPDGRTLATNIDDHTVKLWNIATDKTVTILTDSVNIVSGLAFSPDGHTLAGAGEGAVRLWDTVTGKGVTILPSHSPVSAMAFSPDGTLATAGYDAAIRLWFYPVPDTAISAICAAVARNLGADEEDRYLTRDAARACHS